ncbi:MAG TPA: sigma-70 family RNA polymerase sigma factor [Verrucomicrobiae bacterium]
MNREGIHSGVVPVVETEAVTVSSSVSDERWCKAWYDKLDQNLVLYGRSLGLTHSEAEDVLQDTFIALLKVKVSPAQPQHYILRAYRNRSLNYRRNWWRRLKAEWESAQWFEPSAAENPKEAAAMRCLAELPVEQREVIVLKIWQKMTFDEIGQVLELSPNTAAGRFRYGMEKLRKSMAEYGEEHEVLSFQCSVFSEVPGASADLVVTNAQARMTKE